MRSSLAQRQIQSIAHKAAGFVQTMYFEFNYIKGLVRQTTIAPDAPDNWESETCKLILHVWYEHIKVNKKNPAQRKTREMPPHLKKRRTAAVKKNVSTSNKRREKLLDSKLVLPYRNDAGEIHGETVLAKKEGNYYRIKSIPVHA